VKFTLKTEYSAFQSTLNSPIVSYRKRVQECTDTKLERPGLCCLIQLTDRFCGWFSSSLLLKVQVSFKSISRRENKVD